MHHEWIISDEKVNFKKDEQVKPFHDDPVKSKMQRRRERQNGWNKDILSCYSFSFFIVYCPFKFALLAVV